MEERAQELALYIIENKTTVRAAASRFGISKSTVHKDLSERLPAINRGLYQQVKAILNENKAERHIRGGIATRKKYKGEGRAFQGPPFARWIEVVNGGSRDGRRSRWDSYRRTSRCCDCCRSRSRRHDCGGR